MMILEFRTERDAQSAVSTINKIIETLSTDKGYTLTSQKEIVGRKRGVDNPNACKTTTWAVPLQSPDRTWYIWSPTRKIRMKGWQTLYKRLDGVAYVEKERPKEWVLEDDN